MAWALARAIILACLSLAGFGPAPAAAQPSGSPEATGRLEQLARLFAYRHYSGISEGPTAADDYYQQAYGETVALNGATLTRAEALAVKYHQSEQWPDQSYTVQPRSVTYQCDAATDRCDVSGRIDWRWSSWARAETILGSGQFRFTIVLSRVGLRIVSEAEELTPATENVEQ